LKLVEVVSKRLTREICVDLHINVQRCPHYNKANPTKYFLSACNLYHKTQRGEGATDPYKAGKSRHDLSLSLSLSFTHTHTHALRNGERLEQGFSTGGSWPPGGKTRQHQII